jgi:hypothetical protein
MRLFVKNAVKKALFVVLTAGLFSTTIAQEGHPIKGSWIGEWEGNASGDSLLMVMTWDGKDITGIINPGTDNLEIKTATLNPDDWSVHIEAGDYKLDGKFARLELPNRSISGTWTGGGKSGAFEIVRQ